MNRDNNTYIYSEEAVNRKVEQNKQLRNISFMSLGVSALGASTMFTHLMVNNSPDALSNMSASLLMAVVGGVGFICSQMAKSEFKQELLESQEILEKVYKSLPPSQQEDLLLNKENSSSTIQALREKFLGKNQLNSKLAP